LQDIERNQNQVLRTRQNPLSNQPLSNQTEEMPVNFPNLPEDQIEEHIDNSDRNQGTSSEDDDNLEMHRHTRTLRYNSPSSTSNISQAFDRDHHRESFNVEERFLERVRNQGLRRRTSRDNDHHSLFLSILNTSDTYRRAADRSCDKRSKAEKELIYKRFKHNIPKAWRIEDLDIDTVINSSKLKLIWVC
jgi:hypothetical protein